MLLHVAKRIADSLVQQLRFIRRFHPSDCVLEFQINLRVRTDEAIVKRLLILLGRNQRGPTQNQHN